MSSDTVSPKLCECGCGLPAPLRPQNDRSRGWVAGQPARFIHGHNVIMNRSAQDRFWEKVDRLGPDECWEWLAGKNGRYGAIYVDGQNVGAHRFSYEILVGPIPEGLVLDHLCRNEGCVNPNHLEPVEQRENVLRGEGPSAANVKKTHCPQGHPYNEENTGGSERVRWCRACRAIYQKANRERRNATQRERRRRAREVS